MLLELKGQTELWLQCPDAFRTCRPWGRAKSSCGKEPGGHVLKGQQGLQVLFLVFQEGSGKLQSTTLRGRAGVRGKKEEYGHSCYEF